MSEPDDGNPKPQPASPPIPSIGSVLAIDHGTKRTGFAVTDGLRIATTVLETCQAGGLAPELLDHIDALFEERDIRVFLVGMPTNMDGTEGPRATEVREFIHALRKRFPRIALATQDERLSSKEAEELMREAGHAPKDRRALRDGFSALVILRDWLRSRGLG